KCGNEDWLHHFKITYNFKGGSVEKAVEQCMKGLPFDYSFKDNTIVIILKPLTGRVVDENNAPLEGVSVTTEGSDEVVFTNAQGFFTLPHPHPGGRAVFKSITTIEHKEPVTLHFFINAVLHKLVRNLDVVVHKELYNGFQDMPRLMLGSAVQRSPASVTSWPVSVNLSGSLEGFFNSLLIEKAKTTGVNQPDIVIRGLSTFGANPNPLIVIDNMPYDGDMSNINLNDMESIVVLKDAAAASLWGIRAGNGVIVMISKKGRFNKPLKMEMNVRTSVAFAPNLKNNRAFSSPADYISLEKYYFDQGWYDPLFYDLSYPALSPAVELMDKARNGQLTDLQQQLAALSKTDVRDAIRKYMYRTALNQEYNLNISKGDSVSASYLSLSLARNPGNLMRNDYYRGTASFRNTYLFSKKLKLTSTAMLMKNTLYDNNDGILRINTPYAALADDKGNPLAIAVGHRLSYADTAGGGRLLDWHYRPLDELNAADNRLESRDVHLVMGLDWRPLPGLDLMLYGKYAEGGQHRKNVYSPATFYTRDLINSFTGISTGYVTRPVPYGSIVDEASNTYTSHNLRLQAEYKRNFSDRHDIILMAGAEQPSVKTSFTGFRNYGVNGSEGQGRIDYQSSFPMYYNPYDKKTIDYLDTRSGTTNNVISYYSNITYSYKNRYAFSLSGRQDASNVFGTKAGQKSISLWSYSVLWNIAKEPFLHSAKLTDFKLRFSDGYNGNFDPTATTLTTITPGTPNTYGAPTSNINTVANPLLHGEKTRITNIGVDIATQDNTLEASLDFYRKTGSDLVVDSRIDPTVGLTSQRLNSASLKNEGVELNLKTKLRLGGFTLHTALLFSYNKNTIDHYIGEQLPVWEYAYASLDKPLPGGARFGIYSFRSRGLDHKTGDPLFDWNGIPSDDYISVANSTDKRNISYNGSSMPVIFGSLRNTLAWKRWQASFILLYKMGYYFRRSSINYNDVLMGASLGHADYAKRWQHPGDEMKTTVPSLPQGIVLDPSRDL
ncbi:MAG: SusC/RagA family TonB-linked outer membrane protein, partial [Bacteroidetes bacterium]|nr:SusC/RagA family TonB-linked outer membrane protein [Bacteroidota bacterium]